MADDDPPQRSLARRVVDILADSGLSRVLNLVTAISCLLCLTALCMALTVGGAVTVSSGLLSATIVGDLCHDYPVKNILMQIYSKCFECHCIG